MKKLLAIAALLSALSSEAAPVTLIGTLVTVNNTTSNSTAISVSPHPVYLSNFGFANNGLTDTNALQMNVQLSLDGTNFVTISSWKSSVTNAGAYGYTVTPTNWPVYMRVQSVTTNNVSVGATYSN
jgi:hypothetical protein